MSEVSQPGEGRVDLGGIFVPGVEGMELRVEVAGDAIVAATVVLRDSAVQLQAFAAPKREGIWGEVREEIASGITQQGGIIDEVEGPLGWELRAQVPVQLPDGKNGVQLVRFVGVDGPPGVEGMELRVEVAGDAIVAATVVLRDSAVQLQAFAAPKREGIWGEVREEIASGITQQGGIIDEVEGPLGWELRAQVPVQLPDGKNGVQLVRFVGVDGPRWFLRGVISGQGAVQPDAAGLLETIFRDTVVVRGEGPMAPRDPIVLKLPNDAQMVPEGVQQEDQESSKFSGGMGQLQRGPEITEVR
ncbi:DUF3710 domain-containing protein [Streptomyces sp. gb1(2016)]|uniref:DUF3710 domain-containing protein n=1 Tax=Streptomyces sp. gb1(2016) TaxID=1828321 RepID=A0A652KXC4_9ACTN|nr:DUF3710 domain-containing protein [Streptomyces sp. gb1(2016)]